jgi:hypothetical protein
MNIVAHNLIKNMILDGQDHSQLDNTVNFINKQWADARTQVDDLSRSVERSLLTRKAHEEISTLSDVHEGYHKYINAVEAIANEPQKLGMQLETNRVKLKGMNSYETRLSELKLLTKQLDNRDLIREIELIASKWADTYLLISKLTFFEQFSLLILV